MRRRRRFIAERANKPGLTLLPNESSTAYGPAVGRSPLSPVIDSDAAAIATLVHAPAHVAAAADGDHSDILEISNLRIIRELQPARVRLSTGERDTAPMVDDILIQPVI